MITFGLHTLKKEKKENRCHLLLNITIYLPLVAGPPSAAFQEIDDDIPMRILLSFCDIKSMFKM